MNILNLLLIAIIVILGSVLVMVALDRNETRSSYESLLNEKLQIDELIETFKEKYSKYEITEFPDSKGVPYKYSAKIGDNYVDLILEKDRVVLKAWVNNGDTLCIVSNPIPRDILDNCPLKW